jgi:hypothetical protein
MLLKLHFKETAQCRQSKLDARLPKMEIDALLVTLPESLKDKGSHPE